MDRPAKIPDVIADRYRVDEGLGRGGMADVVSVWDEASERHLALKRMRYKPHYDEERQREAQLRFRREYHTLARLAHPCVVEVYDFGWDDDTPYYTMELLDGRDLRALGVQPWARACEILRDVASALAFLHVRGLIHRDVTARNVRLTEQGRAKLIDFGVLATVGFTGYVAGTPPFIAPESLREVPLDHRADLWSLGALAYLLLTGQHAYPAKSIADLVRLLAERPPPPSSLAPDVPETLDALVLGMLSRDPLGRPAAAAEIIDRLGAIASLPAMRETDVERGYLSSAAMVGRRSELSRLRTRLSRAVGGSGRTIVVEAPSGLGKSRLLRELALEAKIAGARLLRADAGGADARGAYGVLRALARELLRTAPDDARSAAAPHAGVIVRALPELAELLPATAPAPSLGDPTEDRMRLTHALSRWLVDVVGRAPTVVLVDDMQRCDEGSAAVLGGLAHAARDEPVLLGFGLRTDERARAPAAVAAIRDAASRLELGGLSGEDVEALARATFGEVPHLRALATWLHEMAAGSPLHVTELLRTLVDRRIVVYSDGVWSIPKSIDVDVVPGALAAALDQRVAALDERARSLGQVLGLHRGALPLPLCAELADGDDEEELFSSLDSLCYQQILEGDEDAYRFRHDGLREALVRSLEPSRERALHLRIGEALLDLGELSTDREIDVGWHLLKGGDDERGGELLARAGMRLYDAQSFADSMAPLEAALSVLEESDAPVRETLEIRHRLVRMGALVDRRLMHRYLDDTIATLRDISGVGSAERLRPFVGAHLGLAAGVAWAFVRRMFRRSAERGPGVLDAVTRMFTVVSLGSVAHSACFDMERTRAVLRQMEIFGALGRGVPYGAYLLCRSFLDLPLGRWRAVLADMTRVLAILGQRSLTPLSDIDLRLARGAAWYTRAFLAALEHDPRVEEAIERLRELELRFFEVSGDIALTTYHRMRGEEEEARALESRVEIGSMQLGHSWLLELQLTWASALGYAIARDVLGLRRCVETLASLVEAGTVPEWMLDLVRGEYLRERGDYAPARATLGSALSAMPDDDLQYRPCAEAALSETCLALGDLAAAREHAERGLALTLDERTHRFAYRMRNGRALALVEAREGKPAAGSARLSRLIEVAEKRGSPAVCGSLHEARARIALLDEDWPSAEHHTRRTDEWLRPTRNPALVSCVERLREARQRIRASTPPSAAEISEGAVTVQESGSRRRWISDEISRCRGHTERASRVLELLVEETGATHGWLYLCRDTGVDLAAPTDGPTPDERVERALTLALHAVRDSVDESEATLDERPSWVPAPGEQALWTMVLRTSMGAREVVVGAAVLVEGAVRVHAPDRALVAFIAERLYEAGDALSLVSVGRTGSSA